jgi:hypothetical protein
LDEHGEPEVQVCPFSFQVHCTVSPGWMVTDEGEKESSPFPTVTMTVAALPKPNDRPRATAIVTTAVILRNEELFIISFVDYFGLIDPEFFRSHFWPFTGVLRERGRSVTRKVWFCRVKGRAKLEKAIFAAMGNLR